jgi:hypothetical protein
MSNVFEIGASHSKAKPFDFAAAVSRAKPASQKKLALINTASAASTTGRAKLWNLDTNLHCSIIGTCMTTSELRKIIARVCPDPIDSVSDISLSP